MEERNDRSDINGCFYVKFPIVIASFLLLPVSFFDVSRRKGFTRITKLSLMLAIFFYEV